MNIMAAALQIVTKIPQTFNEIFASQDYEEISTFVTTTLDAYWNDDNYSLPVSYTHLTLPTIGG